MIERRKHQRINIALPVRLKTINSDNRRVLDLATKDISYTGAFIPTITSFPEGTTFKLDFTLPTDNLKELYDIESLKDCKGNIVRSTPQGIAICFDSECNIEGLKALPNTPT